MNSSQINERSTLKEDNSFSRLLHLHWHLKIESRIPVGRCVENALKMWVQAPCLQKTHSTVLGKSLNLGSRGGGGREVVFFSSRFPLNM